MLRGLGILAMLAVGGCQAAAPIQTVALLPDVAPTLVLPGTLLSSKGAWPAGEAQREFGRNDDAISLAATPPDANPEWVQFQSSERFRTNNGRPREYSTTTVRTSRLQVYR